jgi:hypothetical protein
MDPLALLIVFVLIVWILGTAFMPVYGLVHVLLVVILVLVLLRLVRGGGGV